MPPKSTHKYQPVDLRLIAHGKIRHRTLFLSQVVNNLLQWASGEENFPESTNQGKYGIRDGHIPHVGDVMTIFNEAWSMIQQSAIRKFWMKSQCLSPTQIGLIKSLDNTSQFPVQPESSSSSVVEINDAVRIFESICAASVIHSSNAPASELLDEVSQVQTSAELLQVLNVSAELDVYESRLEVARKRLQSIYDEQQKTTSTTDNSSIPLQTEVGRQNNAENYCKNYWKNSVRIKTVPMMLQLLITLRQLYA